MYNCFRLVVGGKPDSPDLPEVTSRSDTEILVKWKVPRDIGNAPVLCYTLEYKITGMEQQKQHQQQQQQQQI